MKNIFLLPTNQPSRIVIQLDFKPTYNIKLSKDTSLWTKNWEKNHIYITSDEEIEEVNWFYYENGDLKGICKVVNGQRPKTMILKKIILTTDQKLIANGVQAIDNEFLEWFGENPTCEFIEVNKDKRWVPYELGGDILVDYYKIIIPKEELKLCDGNLSWEGMVTNMTEEYKRLRCGQKYRHTAKGGSRNFFPLTKCTKGILQEESKQDLSKEWKGLKDANLCEPLKSWGESKQETLEEYSYLQRFIDQFSDGTLGELDPNEWDALQFLEWLKLNKYEIIKNK